MKILPQAGNAISIVLNNGDRFDIHTANDNDIVISRPQTDKREYNIETITYDGKWKHLYNTHMLKITKAVIKSQ